MSSIWGKNLKISVFGESHGKAIGVVIDGFPAGFKLDWEYILGYMKRRMPGGNLATSRSESDLPDILSGVKDDFTEGSPICAIIENNNTNSSDYNETLVNPRPSHADLTAFVKYNGYADYRGGGHFSGRLTAPLVFAGALCADYLERTYNIKIAAHIKQIGGICDDRLDYANINDELADILKQSELPLINQNKIQEIKDFIENIKLKGDSVGAVIECFALNVPQSLGAHMFSSVEASISSCIFGIPGVKGIEFGTGFEFASMYGSDANDEYYYDDSENIRTKTNNNGGILGGISTGMPIVFSVVMKPTPSIFIEQNTVNLKNKSNELFKIKGRHDPFIVIRAVPVVEAAAALSLMDLFLVLR
jgi:chorismate synthase